MLTPTRELAAQILEELNDLAVHTPITGAAVFGGVGMGPQEHAFRSGVDVIVATPGRLLDHFRQPYAKLDGIEHLVLDEADRMLDMGFLPDIRRVLQASCRRSARRCSSAPRCRRRSSRSRARCCTTRRRSTSSGRRRRRSGITQAVYPVPQELKSALLLALLERDVDAARRWCSRARSIAPTASSEFLDEATASTAARIHGNRSQAQRTDALAGFKGGAYRVLVATDIAARGIDVEALGHVVNFDVPLVARGLHPSRRPHGARRD